MSSARHRSDAGDVDDPNGVDRELRAAVDQGRSKDRSGRRRGAWRFRNWRVRSKIVVILLVPLIAVLGFSGLRIRAVVDQEHRSGRAEELTVLTLDALALVQQLQAERDLTGFYLGSNRSKYSSPLTEQRNRVDTAIDEYQASKDSTNGDFGTATRDRLTEIDRVLALIDDVRAGVSSPDDVRWIPAFHDYSDMINALLGLEDDITTGLARPDFLASGRALAELSTLKELISSERAYLGFIFSTGHFQDSQYRDFLIIDAQRQAAEDSVNSAMTDQQRARYSDVVQESLIGPIDRLRNLALDQPDAQSLNVDPADWYNGSTQLLSAMLNAEGDLAGDVLDQARALRSDAQRRGAIDIAIVSVVLVLAFALALLVARSLITPLRRLRSEALDIANHRLPQFVDRLRTTQPAQSAAQVPPIRVNSSDEVGEVAKAFNSVQQEAVRIAAEQALLRSNVNAMFVNLSRRTQGLVERQLNLIDHLERGEQDPDQLANLFQLDHLATRMRRNAENLLVLAGADPGRRSTEPVLLLDVLRAATAEVEQYQRVVHSQVIDCRLDGRTVGDVVHLIAELLENALEYSDPQTQVYVSAKWAAAEGISAGAIVEIDDQGIGMTPEELATANEHLSSATEVDPAFSRMGLYVVGRLASRYGIGVHLRESNSGGVTAAIYLSTAVIIDQAIESNTVVTEQIAAPALAAPRAPKEISNAAHSRHIVDPERALEADTNANTNADAEVNEEEDMAAATPESHAVAEESESNSSERQVIPSNAPIPDEEAPDPSTGSEEVTPATVNEDDFLPIYASVQSEWFRRRSIDQLVGDEPAVAIHARTPAVVDRPIPVDMSESPQEDQASVEAGTPAVSAQDDELLVDAPPGWISMADEGWRAAQQLSRPRISGTTKAGLPIRVPMAHYVPGSVPGSVGPEGRRPVTERPATTARRTGEGRRSQVTEDRRESSVANRSPEAVRNLLSTYQRGLVQGREAGRHRKNDDNDHPSPPNGPSA